MRVIQRVFASLHYHWRYTTFFSVCAVLFLVSSLSALIAQAIQGQALSLFEQRIDIIDRKSQILTRWSVLRQILHIRQAMVSDTQNIYSLLFWGFAGLILVLSVLTLIQRKHEFSIYQLAGKNTANISFQFALENLFSFLIAFFIATIILLCIQSWYLDGLVQLNQYWFGQKLPSGLKTLLENTSDQTWRQFNQLFQHQFTTFNGHLLLFDQGNHGGQSLADYDRSLWTLTWQGSALVFLVSYLSASIYNWWISRQLLHSS
ncbi:FtsX-like permease family protein [Loigolactobacillus zhaoyuanensis]|uniref:FtsX-like permease family protein n=1 Tax=Loigolactobacillus zhaoyuanensis TaxID=2486017 RepID=UPI000F748185|nr:FtsX-like permease family protein [Loigolactobacillus zhaoyuanensis]